MEGKTTPACLYREFPTQAAAHQCWPRDTARVTVGVRARARPWPGLAPKLTWPGAYISKSRNGVHVGANNKLEHMWPTAY